MKPLDQLKKFAIAIDDDGGAFQLKGPKGQTLRIIASHGENWDHVSVSLKHRCPTWSEMHFVKGMFFEPEDVVIQYHPRQSQYVNCHPYCLHMWRPQHTELPEPPAWMVGPV